MKTAAQSHQAEPDKTLVKIFVNLDPADWHDYKTESVWAEPLSDGVYRLRNVPFYAVGLSHDDVVRASLVDNDLVLEGVERRSGHST